MNKYIKIITFFLTSVILFGCKFDNSNKTSNNSNLDTFSILAGSELKDIEPLLKEAEKKLGFSINVTYTGTIDGVDQIKNGLQTDAAWFSQSKYFYDTPENSKRIVLSEKIMLSPVVVGMREQSYQKLALNEKSNYNWKNISEWVNKNKLTYAMTDPSESNTGYVSLMGISYSHANTGENIKVSDISSEQMKNFFLGQKINSGSSSWLMEAFSKSNVDFVINYESLILNYNEQNKNDQLKIIYPHEGIITADYPLLLTSKKTNQYKKLVEFLKNQDSQTWILNNTKRRSLNYKIMDNQTIINSNKLLIEMPFSPSNEVSEALLFAYYNEFKKPSYFAFVLDTSGSMAFQGRESEMKKAIEALTVNVPTNNKFAKLRNREKVILMPFSSNVYDIKEFEIQSSNPQTLSIINNYVSSLQMDGGTAIFSATLQAITTLKQKYNNNYQFSVILLTDGEKTAGISSSRFLANLQQLNIEKGTIKVFPVLFGDAKQNELALIAEATNGKIFDSRKKSLNQVFKEIRSYQ